MLSWYDRIRISHYCSCCFCYVVETFVQVAQFASSFIITGVFEIFFYISISCNDGKQNLLHEKNNLDSDYTFIKQLSQIHSRLLLSGKMTDSIQLDQLLNEKNSVEDEGHELEEEQKELKLKVKALTEKIIEELKKKNAVKRSAVKELQNKVNDLENQLNALTVSNVIGTSNDVIENNEEILQEMTDDVVAVTEVAEPIEVDKDLRDRKKRKIF